MSSHSHRGLKMPVIPLVCGLLCIAGCPRGEVPEMASELTEAQLLEYYSPQSIKILPFTKPRSFDDDAFPDGIAVSLRPFDGAGDPFGAYGTFIFELYAFRSAAGDHRGELLQTWRQPVANPDDRKRFWERVTSTYEFQLSWEGRPIPPQKKYLLAVSFQAPGGTRLFDEYTFEFRVPQQEILNALSEAE